jgi:nucleotide-binding universal stress UspA family protein
MGAIVTGFVDSPEGHGALNLAIEEAKKRDSMLVVVHSMRGGTETPPSEIARASLALKGVRERLGAEDIAFDVIEYVRDQSPAQDILAAADESNAELIVIGYRKRTSVGKALLGSQAQEIMMGANCPVLATMDT